MLNLIKYEFIKKRKVFGIAAISAIILNLIINYKYGEAGIAIYLGLITIAMFILYIVDVISMYSKDLNNKSGYMVFMTPNSGYSILGSKVITAILEGIIMLIFYILLIFLSFLVLFGFDAFMNTDFINFDVSFGFTIGHLIISLILILLLCVQFILTIYTAITIRKSLLANVKFKGLYSFIIFIGLNYVITKLHTLLDKIPFMSDTNISIKPDMIINSKEFLVAILPTALIVAVICTILTLISGYLLEKKINL